MGEVSSSVNIYEAESVQLQLMVASVIYTSF